ncbi:HPF/RaiA family ribosome-associated protein [Nitrosococcus wardiae]|uniref:HPF/RaiA family ribosome-associated protein n=1 Tax=Nitrosococcus wardiae TaxID=1814290 RepID=A0A4P7C2C5_9GAMM|nr:HPF/RaiA family ribosome-associated protein [Nitrosococcus wardiae]QBQ55664.1 HPF/RaiA family ribosome-associated protein [Nitrosococcus wardiae]
MKLPLEITFRNMEPSEALEANVREHAGKLDQFYDRIMSCRVVVEQDHKHHRQGNLYHVRIDLTVPGKELVVSREPEKHQAYEDVYVAVRDAFRTMRRQLKEYAQRQRGQEKYHEAPPQGRIAALFPAEDYGIIEASAGEEIYFHRNSVLGADFEQLKVGNEVRFHQEQGEKGPQASTVKLID